MTTQHTPGTWNFHTTAGDHQFAIYSEADETGKDLALVYNRNENSKADAKLMAAAPELLEALQAIVNKFDSVKKVAEAGIATELNLALSVIQRATNP